MGAAVYKSTLIRSVDETERTATFIASDNSVDRYGDIIEADGWDVSNFQKNPQFLFGHDSSALPIGKVLKTWTEGNQFKAKVSFLPPEIDAFADKCWKLLKGGFLNAVSVGFLAKKREPRYDEDGNYLGSRFIEQELLELSLVPVPANANAVQVAKSMNFSQSDIDRLTSLDSGKHEVERSAFELETLKLRLSD